MPYREGVKAPGEVILAYLQRNGEGYVGAMYQDYVAEFRTANEYRKKEKLKPVRVGSRQAFGHVIYLLKQTGAIVFDHAEEIQGTAQRQAGPLVGQAGAGVDLETYAKPVIGMPSPRHYYRIVDPSHPAFQNPEGVYKAQAHGGGNGQGGLGLVPVPAVLAPIPIEGLVLGKTPTSRNVNILIEYLQELQTAANARNLDADNMEAEAPEVATELDRLAEDLSAWEDSLQASVDLAEEKDNPNESRIDAFNERLSSLESVRDALHEYDLDTAVAELESVGPQ